METHKINTAILVLNWNGIKWLKLFLPSLVKYSNDSKIFIIDNASTDKSIDFIKNKFHNIKIIQHKYNKGYAKGYNDAVKKIDAKYFVFINSDIEVTDQWIKPMLELMEKDKQIAACQPKVLDYYKRDSFEYAGASGGFIDNFGYPFCRGRIFNTIELDEKQYDDVKEIFWATGACLFLRGSFFREIGGFDEDFFAHQEEIDLCWRLKNNNYKIMVQPGSVVYHVGGGTLDSNSPFKTYLNFRNNLSMLFKNLAINKLFFVIPIRMLLDGCAAITFLSKSKGLKHMFAIIKAHFSFYKILPILIRKRRYNKNKINLVGKIKHSIIWYKIRGINKFSELK